MDLSARVKCRTLARIGRRHGRTFLETGNIQTTHEILVRYANGLPEGAHASVYNEVGAEYSATADFADGQIAKICLSDLNGMELTFARTKRDG